VSGRPIPLVRRPSIARILEFLHEVVAFDLRKDGGCGDDRAGSVGLHLHLDGQIDAERIVGPVDGPEQVIGCGEPVVGAVQQNAARNEAMAGYLGESATARQAKSGDDAPVIDLLRGGVAHCAGQRPFTHGVDEGLASTSGKRFRVGETFRNRRGIDTDKRYAHGDGARESPAPHLVHSSNDPPAAREADLEVTRGGRHEASGTDANTSWCAMSVVQRDVGQITA
jgi:hypothetical protein